MGDLGAHLVCRIGSSDVLGADLPGFEGPGDGPSVEIAHPPTHADIASRVSTRREAVTKELSRLADTGVIERRGKSLVVPDVSRLERMIDEVKSPLD